MNSDADGKLVSALVRGISILQCFNNKRQELSGKELMDLTGLPKPTLFRLTETLCELGLLRYSERLSKYVPGIGLLNLASPVLARMTVRGFASRSSRHCASLRPRGSTAPRCARIAHCRFVSTHSPTAA